MRALSLNHFDTNVNSESNFKSYLSDYACLSVRLPRHTLFTQVYCKARAVCCLKQVPQENWNNFKYIEVT